MPHLKYFFQCQGSSAWKSTRLKTGLSLVQIMPLALSILYSSCPICQLFSCPDRKRFEIVDLGYGSLNGRKNVQADKSKADAGGLSNFARHQIHQKTSKGKHDRSGIQGSGKIRSRDGDRGLGRYDKKKELCHDMVVDKTAAGKLADAESG